MSDEPAGGLVSAAKAIKERSVTRAADCASATLYLTASIELGDIADPRWMFFNKGEPASRLDSVVFGKSEDVYSIPSMDDAQRAHVIWMGVLYRNAHYDGVDPLTAEETARAPLDDSEAKMDLAGRLSRAKLIGGDKAPRFAIIPFGDIGCLIEAGLSVSQVPFAWPKEEPQPTP